MDFCYQTVFGVRSPAAYELLLDVMGGDPTLVTRRDGVETQWNLITPIENAWAQQTPPEFPNYAAGSDGPVAAESYWRVMGMVGGQSAIILSAVIHNPLFLSSSEPSPMSAGIKDPKNDACVSPILIQPIAWLLRSSEPSTEFRISYSVHPLARSQQTLPNLLKCNPFNPS